MTRPFSDFDARGYPTRTVEEGYALWAASYDETVPRNIDLDLLDRLATNWASARHAADLGCGTGRIGVWLRDQGVGEVDGIDLAKEMLERASQKGVYRRLERGDMCATPFESNGYDVITSVLAVGHVADLASFYGEAARLAHDGASFAVVAYHPYFLLSGIPTHFKHGDQPLAIVNHVHLVSDHVQAAHRTGWRLADLHERVIDDAWVEQEPGLAKYHYKPVSLAFGWVRSPRAGTD